MQIIIVNYWIIIIIIIIIIITSCAETTRECDWRLFQFGKARPNNSRTFLLLACEYSCHMLGGIGSAVATENVFLRLANSLPLSSILCSGTTRF